MEFTGKVKKVMTRTFKKKDDSEGSTTEIWVEEQVDTYPQSGVFEVGQKASVPNEGDIVTIQFSLAANEWQDKVFGKNRAWRIEIEKGQDEPVGRTEYPTQSTPAGDGGTDEDSLPF